MMYTQGEWCKSPSSDCTIVYGEDGARIAYVFGADDKEQAANANLIEAAPLLLEALGGMINKLYAIAERHNDRSCDYDVCAEVRAARYAMTIASTEEES